MIFKAIEMDLPYVTRHMSQADQRERVGTAMRTE